MLLLLREFQTEARLQFAATHGSHDQGTAVWFTGQPFSFEGLLQQGGGQGSGEVRAALAPIETRRGKTAAELEELVDVDGKFVECDAAFGSGAIGVFDGGAAGGARSEPAEGFGESIMERDT